MFMTDFNTKGISNDFVSKKSKSSPFGDNYRILSNIYTNPNVIY